MTKHPATLALLVLLLASGCGWKLTPRTPTEGESTVDPSAAMVAPSFSLPDDDGTFVSLEDLLAAGRPAVLVFYRGHW